MNIAGDYYSTIAEQYRGKLVKPDEAMRVVSADAAFITFGCYAGCPPKLSELFCDAIRSNYFKNVVGIYIFRADDAILKNYLNERVLEQVQIYSPFMGGGFRQIVDVTVKNKKLLKPQYISGHFSSLEKGIICQHLVPDAHLFQVAPMDRNGYFSLGVDGSYSIPMSKAAKKKILEVNPKMPRTFGDAFIHVTQADAIIEHASDLTLIGNKPAVAEDVAIAEYIKPYVGDRSCIQLGIGSVPNAVGECLKDRNDLGVHTELLSDALMKLILNGNVTNKYKSIRRDHTVFNVAVMSRPELYLPIHDNPTMECYPASFVNNPDIIAQIDDVVSINSFVEIDLLGQVASESIGWKQITGTGGQVDYVRGASRSKNGKAFLASHATTKDGKLSKIVPRLNNIVTTPRTDVQYVVTEHGIENLLGMSNTERAKALIRIAAPQFRDELTEEAKAMMIIR